MTATTAHRPDGGAVPTGRRTVHWLCFGNICRSPLVAHLVGERLVVHGLDGQWRAVSAGVADWCGGRPVHEPLRAAAQEAGITLPVTVSRRWAPTSAGPGDLVVPLDDQVATACRDGGVRSGARVVSLQQIGLPFTELADPYGRGRRELARTVRRAAVIADAFLAFLTGGVVVSGAEPQAPGGLGVGQQPEVLHARSPRREGT